MQYVGDRHRLALGCHPFGRHHNWKALDEIAKNLVRRRAGADDHRRSKGCHRHAAGREFLLNLPPRTEVLAEVRPHLPEATEIDDPRQTGIARGPGEAGGEYPVVIRIGTPGSRHRVHQVEGRPAALQGRSDRRGVDDINGNHLDVRVMPPRSGVEFPGLPRETANVVSRLEESRHKATADVAGRPRHTDRVFGNGGRTDYIAHEYDYWRGTDTGRMHRGTRRCIIGGSRLRDRAICQLAMGATPGETETDSQRHAGDRNTPGG